jgi:hypothetical protein
LYETYGGDSNPYNFEIIGFPSNSFNQEPGDENSIIDVCNSYGVTFTMMSKVNVTGANQEEVYQWLTQQSRNCVQNAPVTWNFCKYLINEDGSWHAFKGTTVSPLHSSIVNWITSQASVNELQSDNTQIIISEDIDNSFLIRIISSGGHRMSVNLQSVSGQLVERIFEEQLLQDQFIQFHASHLSTGVYIISFQSDKHQSYRKIIVR